MNLVKIIVLSTTSFVTFSTIFLITYQICTFSFQSNKAKHINSNKVSKTENQNDVNSNNGDFLNVENFKNRSLLNHGPFLTSDLSNDSNEDEFLYHYKSNNYYGVLDITDYRTSIENFHEFQEPNNVNIKGVPWEDSQFIITFALPIFNKVDYLDRVFKSILKFANNPKKNPRNEKIEIVIVDAGSTDGSYEYALKLAKSLNNPANKIVHQNSKSVKKIGENVNRNNINENNDNNDQNIINSMLSNLLTGNKYNNAKKAIRYRNSLITFHNQVSPKKHKNKRQKKVFDSTSSLFHGPNAKVRVIRRNNETYSVIARQIAVEYSTGRYIWQVDPDDEVITKSIAKIIDELRKEIEDPDKFVPNKNDSNDDSDDDDKNSKINEYINDYRTIKIDDNERKSSKDPAADMVEIGYCQYTYENGVLPVFPNCFPKFEQRINSNRKIAERLVTYATSWQLWQCIIKRDTFLKAIETIKLKSPNQERITFADDLFIYSATVYNAKILKSVDLYGYIYYLNNAQSESLKIANGKLDTKFSWRIIVQFIHLLFDKMDMEYSSRFKEE